MVSRLLNKLSVKCYGSTSVSKTGGLGSIPGADAKKRRFTDPVEIMIADTLDKKGVRYVHETMNKDQGLDFYLPDSDVFIECKRFSSERTAKQIEGKNVILIQGMKAAKAFRRMIEDD